MKRGHAVIDKSHMEEVECGEIVRRICPGRNVHTETDSIVECIIYLGKMAPANYGKCYARKFLIFPREI